MKKSLIIPFILVALYCQVNFNCTNQQVNNKDRIVIEADVSKYFHWDLKDIFDMKKSVKLQYTPFHYLESSPPITVAEEKMIDGKVKWILHSNQPVYLDPPYGSSVIVYPGDSLHIQYLADEPVYTGSNNIGFALITDLMKANSKIIKPNRKHSFNASTLEDYLQWNAYLDVKAARLLPLIESYKSQLPTNQFNFYKAYTIGQIEYERVGAFSALRDTVMSGYPGLTNADLNMIWDSTQYKPFAIWLRSLSEYKAPIQSIYAFNRMEVWRRFNFDYKIDSLNNKTTRTYLYYTSAKNKYRGLMRERLMTFVLDEQIIIELGTKNAMAQTLLKDYYSQPGFPEYKQWIKKLEEASTN